MALFIESWNLHHYTDFIRMWPLRYNLFHIQKEVSTCHKVMIQIKKMVRLHLEEGRTYNSIIAEYGVSKASISKWCREFSEECHKNSNANSASVNEAELMKENLRLRRELEERRKENLF
jgi:transposase